MGCAILVVLCGCSPERTEFSWPQPRPLGRELAAYKSPPQPTTVPAVAVAFAEPKGPLMLHQALALALMKNPTLASFGWEVRTREAQALQAGLPPNPDVSIEIERKTETEEGTPSGIRGAEYTVALSQVIEMGGKRIKRRNLASREQTLAGWDYEAARLDVLTQVSKGYIDVVAAQERVALSQELMGLAARSLQTVAERVKAGKVSPMEESKARVALATSRIELKQAQRRLEANQKQLSYIWGTLRPSFARATGNLYDAKSIPPEETVLCLISENPDIARWADEMDQRLAAVELEKARRIPDLTVWGGYRWIGAENNSSLVVGVSSPLPIYNRNQGGIQEAKYRFSKGLEDRESARIRVRTSLAESYEALSSAYAEAVTLRQEVLPEAQSAFHASTEGFQAGKFGYLEVLDAQRTLFEARGQYIGALTNYHKSRADVERLIGTPIHSLTNKERK